MGDVFITGVTGFLGRHLAVRLLRNRDDVDRLQCLVRCDSEDHGRARLRKTLKHALPAADLDALLERMDVVRGDLTQERLGLTEAAWDALAERCDVVIHSAADVRFNQDIQDARSRNVEGTGRVTAFARAAAKTGLRRFDWVGTAFVAGLRRDRVAEGDLGHDEGWKNSYEQSKYEAEVWLRANAADLPLTVYRPSIIVGESTTGATSNFGMLYWPVQIYARGWWRTIVGNADTVVDVVPVDYVADAIEALGRGQEHVGKTFHLAAGPEGSMTIEEIAGVVRTFFGGRKAKYMDPQFFMTWVRPLADLAIWGKKRRVIREGGKFFIPYFSGNPLFDTSEARAALEPLGVEPPAVERYLTTIFEYARQTDFGRKTPDA
jgi:thioester reductase-like protein